MHEPYIEPTPLHVALLLHSTNQWKPISPIRLAEPMEGYLTSMTGGTTWTSIACDLASLTGGNSMDGLDGMGVFRQWDWWNPLGCFTPVVLAEPCMHGYLR